MIVNYISKYVYTDLLGETKSVTLKKKPCVYMVYNTNNEKFYIGKTINPRRRFLEHINRAFNSNSNEYNKSLQKEIRELGTDAFQFLILDICLEDELSTKEYYYIKKYNAEIDGYNESEYLDVNVSKNKLDLDTINKLIIDLKESIILKKDLESKYGVNRQTINSINRGESLNQKGVVYPIRTKSEESIKKDLGLLRGKSISICKCGKEKNTKATYCKECFLKENSKNLLSKEQLIDLFKQQYPVTYIAELCGVSDNAIRKWCEKYEISTKTKDYKNL